MQNHAVQPVAGMSYGPLYETRIPRTNGNSVSAVRASMLALVRRAHDACSCLCSWRTMCRR